MTSKQIANHIKRFILKSIAALFIVGIISGAIYETGDVGKEFMYVSFICLGIGIAIVAIGLTRDK